MLYIALFFPNFCLKSVLILIIGILYSLYGLLLITATASLRFLTPLFIRFLYIYLYSTSASRHLMKHLNWSQFLLHNMVLQRHDFSVFI